MERSGANLERRVAGRMGWRDWLAFLSLVLGVCGFTAWLGWESAYGMEKVARRDFRAVAHWFDPVFFQYNLLMVLLAVLTVPFVTLSYVLTMMGRKELRLYYEIPVARRGEIRERLLSRISFTAYFGSVSLATAVVLLGASIILLFKPLPLPGSRGVDFSLGANVLMMGPFTALFELDFEAYYAHLTRSLTAFQFGFLGAYIYFISSLARAYFTLDLTPHTFVDGTIRMMTASILALVLSFVPGLYGDLHSPAAPAPPAVSASAGAPDPPAPVPDAARSPAVREDKAGGSGHPSDLAGEVAKGGEKSGKGEPWNRSLLPVVSFFFGFYPKRAGLFLEHVALTAMRGVFRDSYRALPLSMLAGMSYAHELRLEREGFDNIENFSTADPVSLAVRTSFGYPQLAQWKSEAWLAIHLREDYPAFARHTGITSGEELELYLSRWDAGRGDAVEHLTAGVPDQHARQALKVKLATLGLLLNAPASLPHSPGE